MAITLQPPPDWTALARAAANARLNAYAPYSNFAVGAAILDEDGAIHTGCNVENASYGLTLCAERVALARAVAVGARRFRAIAIAADAQSPATPCGACRQSLAEFADDLEVILADRDGAIRRTLRLADLLPHRFKLE